MDFDVYQDIHTATVKDILHTELEYLGGVLFHV